MVTIREALLSVAGEDSTSIQTIVETLAGQGFHAHEQAGGAFCLLEADKVAGLNLRQRLALKAAVQGALHEPTEAGARKWEVGYSRMGSSI